MFDRDEQEISRIIENGLEAIQAGRATLEQVLAQHPEQAEAIQAELEAGMWLVARREEVAARPGFVMASRKRVVERIQAEARNQGAKHALFGFAWPKRIAFQWVAAALVIFVLFTGTGGVVAFSQRALPGEDLYAVKRISEQVAYSVTLSEVQRVELSARFTERRVGEIEKLMETGKYQAAGEALKVYEQQVNQTVALLKGPDNSRGKEKLATAIAFKQNLDKHAGRLQGLMASAPADIRSQLQSALNVTTAGATDTEHVIEEIPENGITTTPEPSQTPTPTMFGTPTPAATTESAPLLGTSETPLPSQTADPALLTTPDGSNSADTMTPTPDGTSTPKATKTPKLDNKQPPGQDKQPSNPNKPDKPPKDPPPGKKK